MAEQGRYDGAGGRQSRGSTQKQSSGVSDETRRYEGGFLADSPYKGAYRAAEAQESRNVQRNAGYPVETDSADRIPDAYDMNNDYYPDSGNEYEDDNAWYEDAGGSETAEPYREAYRRSSSGPSMAERASGKANNEIYGRPGDRQKNRSRQTGHTHSRAAVQASENYRAAEPARRKKRHHPLRNFLIFLLILAAILVGVYFLLFRAPEKYDDGVHTRKSGFYNILLCATDAEGERTDTIMLLTIDQKNTSVSLTTIPRDTIVDNGDSVPKLNGVYTDGGCGESGAEALMDAVKELLGFRPDGYMVVNYDVFEDVVDTLGGVWFDVPMDMDMDDAYDHSDKITIKAGEQLLDGKTALAVCRYRYGYAMADIQRQYVQQQFVKAIVKTCIEPKSWSKLPAVYDAFMDNTITDLSGANLRFVALWLGLCYHNGIDQNTLPGEGCTYNGASCFGLYGQSTVNMVNEIMNPFEEDITLENVDILTVSGGELVPSTSEGTAFDPSTYQYD